MSILTCYVYDKPILPLKLDGGKIIKGQEDINSVQTRAMKMVKMPIVATGTHGLACWKVEGTDYKVCSKTIKYLQLKYLRKIFKP